MGPKTTLKNTSSKAQSTHRVAIAGVHSIMMEKSALAGVGGVHAHPLSLYLPSRTKLQRTLQLRGQIHYIPLFHLYPYM
jgi:hypothetical protein